MRNNAAAKSNPVSVYLRKAAADIVGIIRLDGETMRRVADDPGAARTVLLILLVWALLPRLLYGNFAWAIVSYITILISYSALCALTYLCYRSLVGARMSFGQIARLLGHAMPVMWLTLLNGIFVFSGLWLVLVLRAAIKKFDGELEFGRKAPMAIVTVGLMIGLMITGFICYAINFAERYEESSLPGQETAATAQAPDAKFPDAEHPLPIPPEAVFSKRQQDNENGILVFSLQDSKSEIYEYYMEELPPDWEITESEDSPYGDFAEIEAKRGGISVNVDIRGKHEGGSDVVITTHYKRQ